MQLGNDHGWNHQPQHFADRFGGDDLGDTESNGEPRGDRALADARRATDRDDDRPAGSPGLPPRVPAIDEFGAIVHDDPRIGVGQIDRHVNRPPRLVPE